MLQIIPVLWPLSLSTRVLYLADRGKQLATQDRSRWARSEAWADSTRNPAWSTKASCVPRVKSLLAEADERDQDDGLPLTAAIRSQRASPAVTVWLTVCTTCVPSCNCLGEKALPMTRRWSGSAWIKQQGEYRIASVQRRARVPIFLRGAAR